MTNLILGLVLGFAVGLALGLAIPRLRRQPVATPSPLPVTGATSTPLLDSLLGDTPVAQRGPSEKNEKVDNRAAVLHQNLRVKLQYDEEAVERAIARERDQHPHLPEVELMQAAIERWERDNR
jgi:hypothetical protein